MKVVFSQSMICLVFFLINNSSGSPALFKRLTVIESTTNPNRSRGPDVTPLSRPDDIAQEFNMSTHVDLTKDTQVYSGKNVVYIIPKQTQPGYFKIVDSLGKVVLSAQPLPASECKSGCCYVSPDSKASFALSIPSGRWSVTFAGGVFSLDVPPELPVTPLKYERDLRDSQQTVDTRVKTSLSVSGTSLQSTAVDTIFRPSTSKCPAVFTIALLVASSQTLDKC